MGGAGGFLGPPRLRSSFGSVGWEASAPRSGALAVCESAPDLGHHFIWFGSNDCRDTSDGAKLKLLDSNERRVWLRIFWLA